MPVQTAVSAGFPTRVPEVTPKPESGKYPRRAALEEYQ